MRASLLYNPFDLIERLAIASARRRRKLRLKGTAAAGLGLGHIDSLELLELLRDKPPHVIYDVGANVGTWTRLAKALFPAAEVEAFEPLEAPLQGFREQTEGLAGVRLHKLALGAAEGTSVLQVTEFTDASSLLALSAEGRAEFKFGQSGKVEVRVATIDALVASGESKAPNLIKLDVQGYELEALKGAEKSLAGVSAVIAEVSFRGYYENQVLFPGLLDYLGARGFRLEAFGSSLVPGVRLSQADALFVRI